MSCGHPLASSVNGSKSLRSMEWRDWLSSIKAGAGYLNRQQRLVVIAWLKQKNKGNLSERGNSLRIPIEPLFASNQSYYQLFAEKEHQLEENPEAQSQSRSEISREKNRRLPRG